MKISFKKLKMLSLFLALVLLVCTAFGTMIMGKKSSSKQIDFVDFTGEVSVGSLSLCLDENSCEISLSDSVSGAVWYSNPVDRENDAIATGIHRTNLNSTIILTYRDVERNVADTVNSYTGSVYDGNIMVKQFNNGFIVYYKFNDIKCIIPLKYELYEDNLKCTVVTDEIIESEDFPLISISVLPYFGAGGLDDEGYILIPDGSGAIMNFNNGKSDLGSYSQRIYGQDEVVQSTSKASYHQSAKLPVFGIKNNEYAILGVIEEGEALATVNATTSGKISGYNTANISFTLRTIDTYSMGESSGAEVTDITIINEEGLKNQDLTVAFYPLKDGKTDYSALAKKYKQCLIEKYNLSLTKNEAITNIELLAAVKVKEYLFGVPYMKTVVLTDLNAVQKTVKNLNDNNVKNISVLYNGWNNDELDKTPLNNANVISSLGGKKGVKNLLKQWNKTSNKFYLYTDFYRVQSFPGFDSVKNSSIMNLSGKSVVCYDYSFLSYFKQYGFPVSYMISMFKIDKYVNKFSKSLNKLPSDTNVVIGDMANKVSSDFLKEGWNRQNSADKYRNIINSFAENRKVIVKGGNEYALSSASAIIDMPSKSSEFNYADQSVPFYQLVVNGLIDYSYKPLNLSSNIDYDFLKIIETGADLHFYLADKNLDILNKAGYSSLYSVKISDWINKIEKYALEAQSVSKITEGSELMEHKKLQDNVYQSVFANGSKIVTNYNESSVVINEKTIDSMSYVIIEGGD